MSEKKERARILILNHIAQFSLARVMSDGSPFGGLRDMAFSFTDAAQPGSLVALQAAPATKWYLSWLIERSWPEGWACEQYLLESIEDGERANWSNVSLLEYDRGQVNRHPEWRWTDAQHAFNDRWRRVCSKERDAYIVLPVQAIFGGDGSVTLGTRTRHSFDECRPTRIFPNWRRVTKKMMLEFYDSAVAEREASNKRKKEGATAPPPPA